jgi:hypothetical protein
VKQFKIVFRLPDDRGASRKLARLREVLTEYFGAEVVTVDEVPAATEKPAPVYRTDRQRERSYERY